MLTKSTIVYGKKKKEWILGWFMMSLWLLQVLHVLIPGLKGGQQEKLNGTFWNGLLIWTTHLWSSQFMVLFTSVCIRLIWKRDNLNLHPHSGVELTATEHYGYQKLQEKLNQIVFHTKTQIQLLASKFWESHIAESWNDVHLMTVTLNACCFL